MDNVERKAREAYPFIMSSEGMAERNAFEKGYNQAEQDYTEYAQLWVNSGEVNIKSFKQFLKDRGYE